MNPFFICNQQEVDSKLKTLSSLGKSPDGWTHYYRDSATGEEWHLVHFESEYQGGGIKVLKRLPELTTEAVISIALSSSDTNDIIGASLELYFREERKKEDFREQLVVELMKIDVVNCNGFEKERLNIIIYESSLYDKTNLRPIVGKHYTEIEKDADYYRTISEKAKTILDLIKKT